MRNKNSFLLIVSILVLLPAVLLLAAGVIRKIQFDTSSEDFAIAVTPQILGGDIAVLEQHAHVSLIRQQSIADLTKYLTITGNTLGLPKIVQSITGGSAVPLFIFSAQAATAEYTLDVEFTAGVAAVHILLLYDQEQWQITAFSVESNLLAD